MQTSRRETWPGALILTFPDGTRFRSERDVIRVDDWRETPIGRINVGFVHVGPVRLVEIEKEAE